MPALVAGIHVFLLCIWHKDVDGRVEPGHEKPIVRASNHPLLR
jgi:hypothetical protein